MNLNTPRLQTLRRCPLGLARWLVFIACAAGLLACTSAPGIPVKAQVFGHAVETTVDREIARYYLEHFLPGKGDHGERHQQIQALVDKHGVTTPSREDLGVIAQEFSVDFASLFLASQLLRHDCNRLINESFARLLTDQRADAVDVSPYLVLFVPGWDYADNGHLTGADFAQPRRLMTQLGMENHLVALPPTGSVEDNAAVLTKDIARHAQSGKKIIVAGASSAGPAIHMVLAEMNKSPSRESVKAWLNLGGILQGSPLIDYFSEPPRSWLLDAVAWFKGWDAKAIRSMSVDTARARYQRLHVLPPLLIVNYLGVPLSGQLSQYSADKYPLIKDLGPNDGLTLLTDVIAPHSLTVVALGSDHFFAEDPRINDKTVALMKLIVSRLETDSRHPGSACPAATAG